MRLDKRLRRAFAGVFSRHNPNSFFAQSEAFGNAYILVRIFYAIQFFFVSNFFLFGLTGVKQPRWSLYGQWPGFPGSILLTGLMLSSAFLRSGLFWLPATRMFGFTDFWHFLVSFFVWHLIIPLERLATRLTVGFSPHSFLFFYRMEKE